MQATIKLYLFGLTLLACTTVYSQTDTINVSGIVSDEFKEGIAYVNIGIEQKNLGTVSDLKGRFELTIPDSLQGDSITFSHVSYQTYKLAIRDDLSNKEILVNLDSKYFELSEIVVSNKQLKQKKVGTKGRSKMLSMPVYLDRDIYEIAFPIKSQKSIATIDSINIFIVNAKIDTGVFRVNLYESTDDHPGTRINSENVVIESPIISRAWNIIDLSSFNLSYDEDIFVSLEFIPFIKDSSTYQISYGAKLFKSGKNYIRQSSQGKWKGIPFNASIYVDISY